MCYWNYFLRHQGEMKTIKESGREWWLGEQGWVNRLGILKLKNKFREGKWTSGEMRTVVRKFKFSNNSRILGDDKNLDFSMKTVC